MKSFAFLFTFVLISSLFSQPNTEIYLLDVEFDDQNKVTLSNPVNISNNEGYDNQPSFWPDGNSILYARSVGDQTEIARYNIGSGETTILTKTMQGSEYSPTPTPDEKISSIRLDTTGLQLLYKYDLAGNDEVLVEDAVIGYHAWFDKTKLAAFVLGEPSTLQIIDVKSGSSKTVAEKVGRSIHNIPGTKMVSYVDKSADQWIIKSLHPKKNTKTDIVRTQEGVEDYCWTPRGDIIMGKNEVIWIWNKYSGWQELFDLSSYGLSGITRVAVSPQGNQLALVVNQ